MSILKFFKSLPKSWRYTRTLTDGISGASLGSVEGMALFTPAHTSGENENILHYKEEGIFFSVLGKQIMAHQEYLYIYKQQTNSIEKHFSKAGIDTGLFYVLNFEFLKQKSEAFGASGVHICTKDHYQAKYQFLSSSKFKLEYIVIGPTKNYISSTLFEKLDKPY